MVIKQILGRDEPPKPNEPQSAPAARPADGRLRGLFIDHGQGFVRASDPDRHVSHEEANLAIARGARAAEIRIGRGSLGYEVRRISPTSITWRSATMGSPATMSNDDLTTQHGRHYTIDAFAEVIFGRTGPTRPQDGA